MRRTLIFSVRGITQIRGKLAGTLSEIASAARRLNETARGSVVPDVDVFAHALDLSAARSITSQESEVLYAFPMDEKNVEMFGWSSFFCWNASRKASLKPSATCDTRWISRPRFLS
jgi:hypothetical protein